MKRILKRESLAVAVAILVGGSATAQWYVNGKPTADLDFAKSVGEFRAALILTDQPKEFFDAWRKPGDPVRLYGSNRAHRGKPIEAIVIFSNCEAGPDGLCDATVDFVVFRPDGSVYGKAENTELWLKKPPPVKNAIQFGVQTLGVTIEPDDPAGKYRVETTVRDNVRAASVRLTQVFWVDAEPV